MSTKLTRRAVLARTPATFAAAGATTIATLFPATAATGMGDRERATVSRRIVELVAASTPSGNVVQFPARLH